MSCRSLRNNAVRLQLHALAYNLGTFMRTAKRVFQLYWVDMETGEIVDLRLTRTKFLEHFANRAPCLVALEACGGSQHWGRRLRELGHEVRLLPAKMVRPFVGGNKNDAHDARAIWTAVQQPGIKTVAIKTEEQQAILALHRMRQQLVKFRTAQINCLRGLLTEYGEVMPKGRAGMRRGMAEALARVSERLPAMVVEALREQWARVSRLDEEIGEIERRLKLWHRDNVASRRIAAIPGVGVLTATAAVAMMGDPAAFRSGREFAAWLGLVPRHSGTGGRVRMLGISKRGDTYGSPDTERLGASLQRRRARCPETLFRCWLSPALDARTDERTLCDRGNRPRSRGRRHGSLAMNRPEAGHRRTLWFEFQRADTLRSAGDAVHLAHQRVSDVSA